MDTIGGYRLIRQLGAGERAEVFLGHSDSETVPSDNTAAIKVYRAGIEQSSIDREVEALAATRSRHLLTLRDIATSLDGRQCLVLPRLTGGSLVRLLADRPTLNPGEVVTILAPVCDAIAELHDARITHGRIAPGSVYFDDEGAPVVACFGRAAHFDAAPSVRSRTAHATVAELLAEPRVAEDLDGLRALAVALISRARDGMSSGQAESALGWLDSPGRLSEPHAFARELSSRLFDLARAVPVDIRAFSAPSLVRSRPGGASVYRLTAVVTDAHGGPESASPAPLPTRGRVRDRLARQSRALVARLGLTAPIPAATTPAATTLGFLSAPVLRLKAMLSRVRKRFWIIAAAGIGAVVVAIVLVPSGAATDSSSATLSTPTSAPTASSTPPPGHESAAPLPLTEEPGATAAGDAPSAVEDDPVLAAKSLLRKRDGCIQKLSRACLDSVDQRGASALDDDAYLIRSLREGRVQSAGAPLAEATVTLSQRLGDSALLQLVPQAETTPLSILVVRGPAGWRIRDFLPR